MSAYGEAGVHTFIRDIMDNEVMIKKMGWDHMGKNRTSSELPANYEELKADANRTSNWRARLNAVEELGKWKNDQTIDILKHRVKNDAVYKVQEAAFAKLEQWGEDISLPPRKKGELIKGAGKVFIRVKKSLPEGHSFEEFKEKLKKTRIDVYDTYEGEKGSDFDKWLEDQWALLSTGKSV